MIIPSIDLMDGKAVQLVQGKKENKKLEVPDVLQLAKKLSHLGPINVIDLDAAFNQGNNTALIQNLASMYSIRVGGGLKTLPQIKSLLERGVKKVIIGSAAFNKDGINTSFLNALSREIDKTQIIIAIDSYEKFIVKSGWTEKTTLDASEIILALEPYCNEFLYTQVDREGMMQGTNVKRAIELRKLTKRSLSAAGGISTLDEIKELSSNDIYSVLGMAMYTGKLSFEDLLGLKLDYDQV
jgi:phosphoribosylformimino-5-aminoimidazole carboxamide ribotide isomerase